jgi:hypothetical protein
MSIEETELVVSGFNPPEPTIVTHHIGDVTCILMVPEGCPVPDVELYVHTPHTTADERAAAVVDLGLADHPTKYGRESQWRAHAYGSPVRAYVFLLPDDAHAQVKA